MVTAITRRLAATMQFLSGTSLATTMTMTVAATTRIGATVAATTRIGVTVVYPSATTTGTVTQPGMVGLSATTNDNRRAGGLFAVAALRKICSPRLCVTWSVSAPYCSETEISATTQVLLHSEWCQ